MNSEIMKSVAAALANLDISDENERRAKLVSDIATLHAAINRTELRLNALDMELSQEVDLKGSAVADALVRDLPTELAACAGQVRETLVAERASLAAGLGELRQRLDRSSREVLEVDQSAQGKAATAVQPLVDEIMRQAGAAVEGLRPLYAALYAIEAGTRGGRAELDRLRGAVKAVFSDSEIAMAGRKEEVPSALVDALGELAARGPALDGQVVRSAPMP
jgi:hypothetical protein